MLNQKGMSTLEMVPILTVFLLLVNFGMGFFGVIHSGIMNSIAARNYAFETFRSRTNLNYLRDEITSDVNPYYSQVGFRFHSIVGEDAKTANLWIATKRPIKFSEVNTGIENIAPATAHNQTIRSVMTDETKKNVRLFSWAKSIGRKFRGFASLGNEHLRDLFESSLWGIIR